MFALTTDAPHGSPESCRRYRAASGSGSMPLCGLKKTSKPRRPLKGEANA
jgi:hypothetical protein